MLSYIPLSDKGKVIHVDTLSILNWSLKKREPNPTVAEKETRDNQEWWLAKQNIDHGEWGNNAPHSPEQHNREHVC